jgi:hypothetical protein
MPIIPPQNESPYDTVNTVLNIVRGRMNDKIDTLLPTGGRVLENTQPFMQQTVNTAWRKVQAHLAEKGYANSTEEIIIDEFPAVVSPDPASQCWINWSGCFDGANFYPQPALPQNFTHPLKIWERWSNQNAEFPLRPMEKMLDGLPAKVKRTAMIWWEWRGDTIYTPGSQMLEDLRIRFVKYFPDFVDVGQLPWFQQPMPIVQVADGFSWFICAELGGARGDDPAKCLLKGEDALSRIFNLDVRADQRVNVRRRSRSGRGYGGGNLSYC